MRLYIFFGLLTLTSFFSLLSPARLDSANLTTAKDTISNSRLSVAARVDTAGTAAGSSNVRIKSTASAPFNTITTNNINVGDQLLIGDSATTYTVITVVDTTNFTVSPVVDPLDDDDNDPVYLKQRPIHTVTFDTASAVADGYFQVLLPADDTTPNDGNPDDGGFDFGGGSVTVAATDVDDPAGGAVEYDFVTGVATAAGGTGCTSPANYHCFEVHYSGTGNIGSTITIVIGSGANTPIAPAPADTTESTAELQTYIIKNFNSSNTAVDNTSGRIAFIEPVRVTATVDPTISMAICGANTCTDVEPGDTVDGETLSSNTGATSTGTSVALGSLDLASARLQAQKVSIATNGSGGYALTAVDDGNLRKGTDTIDDNVTPPTSPAVLNSPGTEAYGIHPCGTHVSAATWGTGSDSCTGGPTTNEYSGTDTTNILTLVNYTTGPTNVVDTYITYKANISATTAQGDYAHLISYTATATF